ncbi:Gfo/Idh/MocA family protein [Saccharothrix obliqua]|uniref:Gfo/Idh/MocA family protein n=1 Tax=Saccharothrix obliqua TaxID=2861747 RepID=UPI001C5FB2D8|nr:Gfo/Idh/MocA family oxidoreductase [Saccharothrix obliqua]MBW4721231.1 Gfo/Idh/MocA family oxidoreductase [Saccharothrix obliqua]
MSGDSVPVGVIGLGDIARKAYLPVLCAQPDVEPRLLTRDRAKLDRVGDAYRVPHRFTDLDELIASGIRAAFVHTPTDTHHDIVTRLLEADVDVFVDKPLAYTLEESRALVSLARERNRSLAVGFNRRHAPAYAVTGPCELVMLQKDRRGGAENVRTAVMDDFIHLVDTLRALAPGTARETHVHGSVVDGLLHHVVLQLTGPGFTGLAVMNRDSGTADELLQTAGAGRRREVLNLVHVTEDGVPRRSDDWASVGHRRGFEPMCRWFLDAVHAGTRLDAGDALLTHELCEEVITALTGPVPGRTPARGDQNEIDQPSILPVS